MASEKEKRKKEKKNIDSWNVVLEVNVKNSLDYKKNKQIGACWK